MLGVWRAWSCAEPLLEVQWQAVEIGDFGKLRRVDKKGQQSTCIHHAPEEIVQVASLHHQSNSVFVNGMVNGKFRQLLLDTGATKTIIKPNIVQKSAKIRPTKWKLRTATGEPAAIHGEVDVKIIIGSTLIQHPALIADIEDEVILGMDIMSSKDFELNFKRGVLKINGEEVVLQTRKDEAIRVILATDTQIPERSEVILEGSLDGQSGDGSIVMFELRTNDNDIGRGVAVGKALVRTTGNVPVRVINANDYPLTLRKGILLGYCTSVSSIVRNIDATKESTNKCPEKLLNLAS